jgi:hypothetical protein
MIIANGKQFDSYQHLQDWCTENGFRINNFQQVNVHYALAQLEQLDEHEIAINRDREDRAFKQELQYAAERKFYGRVC